MKIPNTLLFLLPMAFSAQAQLDLLVDPTPSLSDAIPPTPLPALQASGKFVGQDGRQQVQMANVEALQPGSDAAIETSIPAELSVRSIRLKSLSLRDTRKTLQVRSEGTLGQTPWIGMAIGLTCTTLAAVMLG